MRKRTYLLLAACVAAVLLVASAGPPTNFSVTVVNPTTQPVPIRDVDNPAFQPFVFNLCGPPSLAGPCPSNSFTIPSVTVTGQPVRRFVLEYMSGGCGLGTGSFFDRIAVVTSANGGSASYQVIPIFAGTNGPLTVFSFAQQLRGYADPATDARLELASTGVGIAQCDVTVSGYLVTK
jgi:hypothetical protein